LIWTSFGTGHAPKPVAGANGPTRERFIRDKYERRNYFDVSILARYYQGGISEEESDSDEAEPTGLSYGFEWWNDDADQ
jgi:hypothetical protein